MPRIVCACETVEEARVVAAIRRGATSLPAIAAACGAGKGCGACRPWLEALLARPPTRRRRAASSAQLGLFPEGGLDSAG